MSDYFEVRDRIRKRHTLPPTETAKRATTEQLGGMGFLTEVGGRVILTAPAKRFTEATALPAELASRWQEKAAGGNQHFTWIQGRYVEAEKANRNGAFWSTDDLQFGEMSVTNGPLNWLHDEKAVIGTIADNALIHPGKQTASFQQFHEWAQTAPGVNFDAPADRYTFNAEVVEHQLLRGLTGATPIWGSSTTANLLADPMSRPYMAAVSAIWRWVHPDKAQAVEAASEEGRLWYSMECIGREMSCVSDETHEGCGKSFDYVTAMTQPASVCEHIAGRSSARRIVDPTFLGGAVIVPPTQPGWGQANAEVIKHMAQLAETVHSEGAGLADVEWIALMEQVVRFATS